MLPWIFLVILALGAYPAWAVFRLTRGMLKRGPQLPQVTLTIDDGPHPESTPRYLTALAQAQVQATFFCPGKNLQAFPELARQICDAGHEIANHTFYHNPWSGVQSVAQLRDEFARAQTALLDLGIKNQYFRPVAGILSPPLASAAHALGLLCIGWTARARDGGPLRVQAEAAFRRLKLGLVPGGILVVHDNPASPGPTLISRLCHEAAARGLTFVPLGALLAAPADSEIPNQAG